MTDQDPEPVARHVVVTQSAQDAEDLRDNYRVALSNPGRTLASDTLRAVKGQHVHLWPVPGPPGVEWLQRLQSLLKEVAASVVVGLHLRPDMVGGKPDGPEFLRLDQMQKPDLTDEWLVEGLLRPGVIFMLGAPKGIGKSQVRSELGLLLAKGEGLFLGHYPVVSGPLNVLVLDEENGDAEEWRRDEIHMARLGIARAGLPYYRVSHSGLRLDQPEWQAWLGAKLDEHQPDVLFLDSISMLYGVEERRERLMPIHDYLRQLMRLHPRLTIVLVHHLKKKDTTQSGYERVLDDLRGGGWDQWVEAVAIMSALPDRRVHWRTWKRIPHSELTLLQSEDGPLVFLSEVASTPARINKEDKVLSYIDSGAQYPAEVEVAATGVMSPASVTRALTALRKAGLIEEGLPLRRTREPILKVMENDR